MNKEQFDKAYDQLTYYKKEVLWAFLEGNTDQEFATAKYISTAAVRKQISEICQKFGMENKLGERDSFRENLINLFVKYKPDLVNPKCLNKKANGAELKFPEDPVALNSPFYVERPPIETDFYKEILKPGALIRIKAPHKMGKTSLMSRVFNQLANQQYRKVALNLRDATTEDFENLDIFLQWFCTSVGVMLGLSHLGNEDWNRSLGNCKIKSRIYFEKYLLPGDNPLVLALDKIDRIFLYPKIAGEFLGMLRTWHEDAKTRPLWQQLRLVVLHTEKYIDIDIHQSPFNAGKEIKLTDFSQNQVQDLARWYKLNWDTIQVEQLMGLVGGHPYLVQIALESVARQEMTLEELLQTAPAANGPYSDHLRQQWRIWQQYPELVAFFNKVVMADTPVELRAGLSSELAVKLDELGLIKLQSNRVELQYELYRQYFRGRFEDTL